MTEKYCKLPKSICEYGIDKKADCENCELNKRFTKRTIDNWESYIIDNKTGKEYGSRIDPLLDLLNELIDENEQLKQFQTNVFTLLNEMIETSSLYRKPIKSLDYGDDLGYWNGVYQKLKELKDILENDETRR